MKLELDPQADALYLRLNDSKIAESEQVRPGIILGFDSAGNVIGVEVLDVSKRFSQPEPTKAAA
jgi:uncharacterized protein YuzE